MSQPLDVHCTICSCRLPNLYDGKAYLCPDCEYREGRSETKHTPGPWSPGLMSSKNWLIRGREKTTNVAEIFHPNAYMDSVRKMMPTADEAIANVNLVAAAPDLLAALVKLCDASPLAILLPPEEAKPFSEAYGAARAAIAKATGN